MPIKEAICRAPKCPMLDRLQERYYRTSEKEAKPCDYCGGPTEMQDFSRFAIVFTGPLTARYNDKSIENSHQEGHWAWRKRTPDGKPQSVFIDSFSKQREFCKAEGLANPKDLPNYMPVSEDGKRVLNASGMPGTGV